MAEKTLTAAEFAAKMPGSPDAKTTRRFLRKQAMGVGQGNRYAIPVSSVTRLKKEFAKWAKAEAEAKAAREAEKAKQADSDKVDEVTEEADTPETDTSDEPTNEDLQDIEDTAGEEPEEL